MSFNIIQCSKIKKEKIIKLLNNLCKILIYILMFILFIFICINEMGSIKTFNYEAFVIVSDSMKPEINTGDIVIIEKVLEEKIKANDIITFEKDGEYITHRIKETKYKNEMKVYITKGDNNSIDDVEEVYYEEIKGIKIAKIPYIGLLIIKISTSKSIIVVFLIFILLYVRAVKIDNKNRERVKKKRIEDEKVFKDNGIH